MRLKSAVNVGNVHTTSAEFAGYQVQNQAFRAYMNTITVGLSDSFYLVLVTNTSTFSSDIHAQGYDGLLGLGPNKASVIRKQLGSSAGDTTLQRIFSENTTSQNYITFLLDRKNDPGNHITGQLTLSEVIPGFENITSMPKLDVDKVNRLLQAGTQSLHMAFLYLIKYQINTGRHSQIQVSVLLDQTANLSSLTPLSLALLAVNLLPSLTLDTHSGL